jgi:hypothetical protein
MKLERSAYEKLHNSYSSLDISMIDPRMRWMRHVARMGEGRNAHRTLVGKQGEVATCEIY